MQIAEKRDLYSSPGEIERLERFLRYIDEKESTVVLLSQPGSNDIRVIRSSDSSRYFKEGRRRIRGKIFRRIGKFSSTPAYLLSLTYDPKRLSRTEAWRRVGKDKSRFMNYINIYRRRRKWHRARYVSVVEPQKGTGYPHVHLVFPKLKYLAPIKYMSDVWDQGPNAVDYELRDSINCCSYVCKYVSKLDGWDETSLSYIWSFKTRLYHLSQDFCEKLGDRPVSNWSFMIRTTLGGLIHVYRGLIPYDCKLLGADTFLNTYFPNN